MPTPETFIYVLRLARPGATDALAPAEEAVVERHFAYLKGLLAEGRLVLAGPCLDRAFGIVVLEAPSREAAKAMMERDPAIAERVMAAELHPFRVSLERQASAR